MIFKRIRDLSLVLVISFLFHWIINSISAHNFIKISLFDILCLSETYLDSNVSSIDNKNLTKPGYDLHKSDHQSNIKHEGVCVYYKNFIPLKEIDIQYLQECINFEMKIGGKLCNFIVLYCSPSQSQDDFETFLKNFEKIS